MDAAADYSAAARLLKAPLPAYVTYVERSYATAFSHTKDTSQTIVIRTRDGAVIKGDPSKVKISTDRDIAVNPVSHPPFDAACYVPRAATSKQWNDRTVEAIALRDTCHQADDTQTDFDTLYLDPVSHEPLAAVADSDKDNVTVNLEERIVRVAGHALPGELTVHIAGHGIASFLDITAGQQYTAYAFSDAAP